jgi:hypothetical protein
VIFQPDLAEFVVAGRKTVTRRLCSDNERSPWFRDRCAHRPGESYAVQPGRGKTAICRVTVLAVERLVWRVRFGWPKPSRPRRRAVPSRHGSANGR